VRRCCTRRQASASPARTAALPPQARLHLADCASLPASRPAGNILLIDEIHTPDSSRYWLAGSYEARHAQVCRVGWVV
jgi:phosphoribosylaminoimidazole-succinocarboxamide synthase